MCNTGKKNKNSEEKPYEIKHKLQKDYVHLHLTLRPNSNKLSRHPCSILMESDNDCKRLL